MLLSNNVLRFRIPYAVIFLTLSICMLGVLNLLSAAQATRPNLYLVQTLWVGIGFVLGLVICFIRTDTYKSMSYLFYFAVIIALLLVFIIGIKVKGAQRWIDLGFFNFQPSELAKISIVFVVAKYFSEFKPKGGITLRALIRPLNMTRPIGYFVVVILALTMKSPISELALFKAPASFASVSLIVLFLTIGLAWLFGAFLQISEEGFGVDQFVAPIDIVMLPFLLILLEPDLGTALVVFAIAGSMILFCGIRKSSLIIAFISALLLAAFSWATVLKDYQKQRIETFLNPEADIHGHGYHAAQSIIAIGSGKIAGKGFKEGTQTQLSFLPENSTDFVFSVLAEEWGFLGTVFLLILYLSLIIQLLMIGYRVQDKYSALLVVGSSMILFWHVVVNTGMVTGLLPVVGVPLPLMSYGGSSMLTQLSAIALCVNVAIWRKN